MKEQSIVDVIVYLLEAAASQQTESDQATIKQQLGDAGFDKEIIAYTFDWLRELIEQQNWYTISPLTDTHKTLRIFSAEEIHKISLETRRFILSLEHAGILDTKMREIAINQLMQLNQSSVDLVDAKWVVLLVLMSKSNKNGQEMRSYFLTTMAQEV